MEVLNDSAPHSIMFEYCTRWNYEPRVRVCIEQLEQKFGPGTFSYYLKPDTAVVGRLEVTVFKGQHKSIEGEGNLAWSKKTSNKYPAEDWELLFDMVQQALDEWWLKITAAAEHAYCPWAQKNTTW